MISEIKADIEEYFKRNWVITPINWEGTVMDKATTWIAIKLIPIDHISNTCNRSFYNLQLQVLCYAKSNTKVMELSDEVNEFARCLRLDTCYLDIGSYDGLGVQPLENGVNFINTIFEVNSIN